MSDLFTERVTVPRHGRDGRPKVLLPEHAPNAELAQRLIDKRDVPSGVAAYYTRATTYAGTIDDRFALEKWMKRQVAIGLTLRPALLKAVDVARADKERLNELCEEAMQAAGSSDSATVGTSMHSLTEMHDSGVPVDVTDKEMQADLAAYIKATAGLTMLASETFVVNDEFRIGGTFDRLVEYQGKRYIADLKTGASIDYGAGAISMQLATYARSDIYNPVDGSRTPHGADQRSAIVMHLPQGQGACYLKWLNIEAGWEAVHLARQVREWRWRKDLTAPMLTTVAA